MTKVQRKSLSRSPSLEQLFCTQDQRLCSTPWELEYPVPWHRCLALGLGLETFLGNNIETKMVNERYDLELSCFISLNAGGEGLSSRITQAHTPRFPIFESSVPYSQAQVDKMFSNQSWYVSQYRLSLLCETNTTRMLHQTFANVTSHVATAIVTNRVLRTSVSPHFIAK